MTDMAAINARSALKRGSRAQVRRDLNTGTITLTDLLADPPETIHGLTVLDVLRMLRRNRAANLWEQEIGRHALTDQVNLLVRVGSASRRTLDWASEHGEWHVVDYRRRDRSLS